MFKPSFLNNFLKQGEAGPDSNAQENELRSTRRAIPDLRREITFQRRQSEQRDKLEVNEPDVPERRALSADGTFRSTPGQAQLRATSSVPSEYPHYTSNLDQLPLIDSSLQNNQKPLQDAAGFDETLLAGLHVDAQSQYPTKLPSDIDEMSNASEDVRIQEEASNKWILNLSMHFRDKSDREKLFITYMRKPNEWIRVTVSCDYRQCSPDSLEADLKSLHYQRDKSGKIYEAIWDSLPDIQFFTTVTNLKLQTEDGRLHVHVTEDVNEIIEYPPLSLLPYIPCPHYPESSVDFDTHESGFVYGVNIHNKRYIKKEIPGPGAVEEFLYEINALNSLRHSQHVISLKGLVVDDAKERIKGLVLDFASNGALIDLLYDQKETGPIAWSRRLKWANQIAEGLSDIHEAGFVQGDFTLSNIVIDDKDNAQIIDINRRGCPVGWEPPEMVEKIEAGQKISIYIGVKTDIFQMGMVLWALAEGHDEPERVQRPLTKGDWSDVPQWYVRVFEECYAHEPQKRPAAKEVLKVFQSESWSGTDKILASHLVASSNAVGAQPDENPFIDRGEDEVAETECTDNGTPQEVGHPSSYHEPLHVDSGFGDFREEIVATRSSC